MVRTSSFDPGGVWVNSQGRRTNNRPPPPAGREILFPGPFSQGRLLPPLAISEGPSGANPIPSCRQTGK
jgi:hypothetical protein